MADTEASNSASPAVKQAAGPELSAGQLYAILELRVAVFVVEQDCPYQEIDGNDLLPDTRHIWIEDDHGIAATIRVLGGPDNCRVGRVVTRSDRRGEQLSAALIRSTLDQLPGVETRLEAQSHLVNYYATFGYEPAGPEYLEDGIPHTPMHRPATELAGDGVVS